MAARILTINATMVSATQVSVMAAGKKDQHTYPSVDAFLRWINGVHQRVVEAGGVLWITTGHGPQTAQHPADLALREAIGETGCAECLR
jgi:hypothetical protein